MAALLKVWAAQSLHCVVESRIIVVRELLHSHICHIDTYTYVGLIKHTPLARYFMMEVWRQKEKCTNAVRLT